MAETDAPLADLEFDLQYDGPAYEERPEMDVQDLAPALLATGRLFQELNRILRPTDPDVAVNIRATDRGSFKVNLHLIYLIGVATLTSPEATAMVHLLELTSFAGKVISFIKRKARFGIKDQRDTGDGNIEVDFDGDGGVKVIYPKQVLQAERSIVARRELREITRPVTKVGTDIVRLLQDQVVIEEVSKDDAPAFAVPALPDTAGEIVATPEDELWLTVIASHWPRGSSWRFNDGQNKFWAQILDETFWDGLEQGERYGSGDQLLCVLRRVQSRQEDGSLNTETEIVRVLDHRMNLRPDQPELFDEGD
jgi:hypothetical protein